MPGFGLRRDCDRLARSHFGTNEIAAAPQCETQHAISPDDASDSLGLIRCADIAMYRAKMGQQSFEIYRSDGDDSREPPRTRGGADGAFESGQLAFSYQP